MLSGRLESEKKVEFALRFLASSLVDSIVNCHTNDLGGQISPIRPNQSSYTKPSTFAPFESWNDWWTWSRSGEGGWKKLIDFARDLRFRTDEPHDGIPTSVRELVRTAHAASLPRETDMAVSITDSSQMDSSARISQKKSHEVSRMVSCVNKLLDRLRDVDGIETKHIVDIGSGQGYLSRALCGRNGVHVLALDSSEQQMKGASKRTLQAQGSSTLTFRTFWLGEGPSFQTHPGNCCGDSNDSLQLEHIVEDWLNDTHAFSGQDAMFVPVVFVALHACGSLTPDILRKVITLHRPAHRRWNVVGAVVVGCCYNLLREEDFPLSNFTRDQMQMQPTFKLTNHHRHLAAQTPCEWFRSEKSSKEAELAVRKITYRALLSPVLNALNTKTIQAGLPPVHRIGKLNRGTFESFDTFLKAAETKLELAAGKLLDVVRESTGGSDLTQEGSHIEVLHALRCIIGPVCESLFVLDRLLWLKENLEQDGLEIQLVNLFDQGISERNIGITIESRIVALE